MAINERSIAEVRAATSRYFPGENDCTCYCTIFGGEYDCNMLFYLTTRLKHNFTNFVGRHSPGCGPGQYRNHK